MCGGGGGGYYCLSEMPLQLSLILFIELASYQDALAKAGLPIPKASSIH